MVGLSGGPKTIVLTVGELAKKMLVLGAEVCCRWESLAVEGRSRVKDIRGKGACVEIVVYIHFLGLVSHYRAGCGVDCNCMSCWCSPGAVRAGFLVRLARIRLIRVFWQAASSRWVTLVGTDGRE